MSNPVAIPEVLEDCECMIVDHRIDYLELNGKNPIPVGVRLRL